MTPDVNVLIVLAFRRDHAHHGVAIRWLAGARVACADGRESLALLPMVVAGFLRLVTNSRVFSETDSIADAVALVDALLDSPGVELRPCGEEWPILRAKPVARGLSGNAITDAWIASATESCSEHLVTFDRDFVSLLAPGDFTLLDGKLSGTEGHRPPTAPYPTIPLRGCLSVILTFSAASATCV